MRRWPMVMMALLIGGCGASSPPKPVATSISNKLATAQATHEYPSPRPVPQAIASASSSAAAAVRAFATIYINWTADTVAAQMRVLAALSVGQARSAMQLAAAQTAHDYELQRGGIANSGTVQAVAPLLNGHDRFVVVTRELTTATNTTAYQGLGPEWHLAVASVVEVGPGAWAVSQWQPEN